VLHGAESGRGAIALKILDPKYLVNLAGKPYSGFSDRSTWATMDAISDRLL
jgi:hypothetical protein